MKNKLQHLLIITLLVFSTATAADDFLLKVGDVVPPGLGKDTNGEEVNVPDLAGKIVVISFWASWCAPCLKELPILENIVQSHRDHINAQIKESLDKACKDWGIEVTRTEILDVDVDENTKKAMQQQINAERNRRAEVMKAEGEKKSRQLMADAELYTAQKQAEAKRMLADADAYATTTIAEAINNGGGTAIEFEILKRQVTAVSEIASSDNSKLIVLPNEFIKALDSVKGLFGK